MSVPNRIGAPKRNTGAYCSRVTGSHQMAIVLLAGCMVFGTLRRAPGQVIDGAAGSAPENAALTQAEMPPGAWLGTPATTQPVSVVNQRAIQYRQQGRLREAAELFQEALAAVERDPLAAPAQHAAAAHNLGEVRMRLGQYEAAAAWLGRAATFWSEAGKPSAQSAATLFQLGHLRRLQGRYDEASEMLQRGTALCQGACQDGREAVIGLALWGDLHLAQGRLAEAEAAYTQAGDRAPQGLDEAVQADIWSGLAIVYRRQARYREAEQAARGSIALARQSFGEQHAKVAVGLANLGLIQAFERQTQLCRYKRGNRLPFNPSTVC